MRTARDVVRYIAALAGGALGPAHRSVWLGNGFVLLTASRGELHIDAIWVAPDKRRGGHGGRMLRRVLRACDQAGVTARLRPHAYSRGRSDMRTDDLERWYARHGFVSYRRRGVLYMRRAPQQRVSKT